MDDRIVTDLKESYGISFHGISPVAGGWLNRKWKISTDDGELLVKKYSYERYRPGSIAFIESALQRQMILEKRGVPCPAIRPCGERAIRLLDGETAYMVMDFCPGWIETPGTVTLPQMRELGSACGFMHRAFSKLPVDSVRGYPIDARREIDSLWANYRTRMQNGAPDEPAAYRNTLTALEPILRQLTEDFFDRIPKGIAHEDFSPDNFLFTEDRVSAILDFDRSCYNYLWHDVGRAILSLSLEDGKLNAGKIAAFVDGYARHLPLKLADVADAFRITWCVEVPWWIQPSFFEENHNKVLRFRDEMIWLTENWSQLDSLIQP